MLFMNKEIFLLPNILSIFRLIAVIPVGYFLFSDSESSKIIIFSLFVFMLITDLSDGYVARKFNQVSETGKIIDPLVDKISIAAIAIMLLIKGLIPLWFIIVVLGRDILILIFGMYIKNRYKVTLMSNNPGRLAALFIGLILLLSIINHELLNKQLSFIYIITIGLILYSSILYLKRFIKTIGETKNGKPGTSE